MLSLHCDAKTTKAREYDPRAGLAPYQRLICLRYIFECLNYVTLSFNGAEFEYNFNRH